MLARVLSALLLVCACSVFAGMPSTDALLPPSSSNPHSFVASGSLVFFIAKDEAHGRELWRTDGTAAGTIRLSDFEEGPADSSLQVAGPVDGGIVFVVSADSGRALWRSDGTIAGTYSLGEMRGDVIAGYFARVIPAGSRVFVMSQPDYGKPKDLAVSNLAPNSLRPVGTYAINSFDPVAGADGRLYFTGSTRSNDDRQLWVSDGSGLRTGLVRRRIECPGPDCGPGPHTIFTVGGRVLFLTEDALWRTDGTAAGTERVAPILAPSLYAVNATTAYLRFGDRLWRTDGSSLVDAGPAPSLYAQDVVLLDDGRLIAIAESNDRFVVRMLENGGLVELGTFEVGEYIANGPAIGVAGSRVLVAASDDERGTELWAIDADARTIAFVADLDPRKTPAGTPQSSRPDRGVTAGGRVFFSAVSAEGRELWVSDGTAEGTRLVANIHADPAGGAVSGRVVDAAGGAPIAAAIVSLCSSETSCFAFARSDADGRYRFENLEAGSYVVMAYGAAHVTASSRADVALGAETTEVDFALTRGQTISGSLRLASTGEPVRGDIVVRDESGALATSTFASTWTYQTRALPPGRYFVEARVTYNGRPYVNQIHPARDCVSGPCAIAMGEPVTITATAGATGIDFAIREHATISGTVHDANGQPRENAGVRFTNTASQSWEAATDANGAYRSPQLPPGAYTVTVPRSVFFEGAEPATPVQLGVDPVTGIDFTTRQIAGVLAGIVLDRHGAPVHGVTVMLRDQTGRYISAYDGPRTTDTAGRFLFGPLPAGTYTVSAHDELHPNVDCFENPCSVQGATLFTVADGATTRADFRLRAERTTIRGRITNAKTGEPVQSGGIAIYAADGRLLEAGRGIQLDGTYEASLVSRHTAFLVMASAEGYHRTAYPGVRAVCTTSDCRPPGALPVPAGTSTADFAMDPFGVISGRLVDAVSGKPVRDGHVTFWQNGVAKAGASTSDSGYYFWDGADGSYQVKAEDVWDLYAPQVFAGIECTDPCDTTRGQLVTAANGVHIAEVDFLLRPLNRGGAIAGRVVDDETGLPIEGVSVTAIGQGPYESGAAVTDGEGRYFIDTDALDRPLANGEYRLYASHADHYYALYGGAHCADFYACDRASGTPVHLTGPGPVTGIDFRMIRVRTMRVSPAFGSPAGGTRVVITGKHFPAKATVRFGTAEAQIVSITPTEIVAITPPGSEGPAHVTVGVDRNSTSILLHGFVYASTSPRRRSSR